MMIIIVIIKKNNNNNSFPKNVKHNYLIITVFDIKGPKREDFKI